MKYAVSLMAFLALMLGFTTPAHAQEHHFKKHTDDISIGAYQCQPDGTFAATVTMVTSNVPSDRVGSTMWRVGDGNFDGTPSDGAGMDRGPVSSQGNQTVVLGEISIPGDTVGKGPWVYAWTEWRDGNGKVVATKGSDTQSLTDLAGNCKPTTPPTCKDTPSMCPPPPHTKHAWYGTTRYCNKVTHEGGHNNRRVEVTNLGHGDYKFKGYAVKGAKYKNGKSTLVKYRHVKRTGCGDVSGY